MDIQARNRNSRRGGAKKQAQSKIGCGVCGVEDGKYKCPRCRLPYCSVKCCKDHKAKCPIIIAKDDKKPFESETSTVQNDEKSRHSEYLPSDILTADPIENALRRRQMLDESDSDDDSLHEDGWKISKEIMDRLDNSPWLKKELADGGLRQMIATIDNAKWEKKDEKKKRKHFRIDQPQELTQNEAALERAKHSNPKFAKFIDRLLLTAGVLVDNKKVDDDIVSALLGNDIDSSILTLASIPCKRKLNIMKQSDNSTDSNSGKESNSESEADSDSS